MWYLLIKHMKLYDIAQPHFCGFMINYAQTNWNVVCMIFGSGMLSNPRKISRDYAISTISSQWNNQESTLLSTSLMNSITSLRMEAFEDINKGIAKNYKLEE